MKQEHEVFDEYETWKEDNQLHIKYNDGTEVWMDINDMEDEINPMESNIKDPWVVKGENFKKSYKKTLLDDNQILEEWWEYNKNKIHHKDSTGKESWIDYNEEGKEKQSHHKDSTGEEIWIDYNEEGKEKQSYLKAPTGEESWIDYNEEGKVKQIHHKKPTGEENWIEYDNNGREIHYWNEKGYHAWKEYDIDGNNTIIRDSNGKLTKNSFDENNNLILTRTENYDVNNYQNIGNLNLNDFITKTTSQNTNIKLPSESNIEQSPDVFPEEIGDMDMTSSDVEEFEENSVQQYTESPVLDEQDLNEIDYMDMTAPNADVFEEINVQDIESPVLDEQDPNKLLAYFKAALKCKSGEEYSKFYHENINKYKHVFEKKIENKVFLFNSKDELDRNENPIFSTELDTPKAKADYYDMLNKKGWYTGNIPEPQDIDQDNMYMLKQAGQDMANFSSLKWQEEAEAIEKRKKAVKMGIESLNEEDNEKDCWGEFITCYKFNNEDGSIAKETWIGKVMPNISICFNGENVPLKGALIAAYNQDEKTYTISKFEDGNRKDYMLSEKTLFNLASARIDMMNELGNDEEHLKEADIKTDFYKKTGSGQNCFWSNKAEYFYHNYIVSCKQSANNPKEALEEANRLYKQLPKEEKIKLKQIKKAYEEEHKIPYDSFLLGTYKDNVEPFKESITEKGILGQSILQNNNFQNVYNVKTLENDKGAEVQKGSGIKIGDEVSLSLKMKSVMRMKKKRLPYQKYTIIGSCDETNNIVLLSEDGKSKFELPKDNFVRDYGKIKEKDQKKQFNQDIKNAKSHTISL